MIWQIASGIFLFLSGVSWGLFFVRKSLREATERNNRAAEKFNDSIKHYNEAMAERKNAEVLLQAVGNILHNDKAVQEHVTTMLLGSPFYQDITKH